MSDDVCMYCRDEAAAGLREQLRQEQAEVARLKQVCEVAAGIAFETGATALGHNLMSAITYQATAEVQP